MSEPFPPPDVRFHRPNDGPYLSELVTRSGMSVNKIAEQIGVNSRTLRYALKGEAVLPYTAQYALEALARNATGADMNAVLRDEPAPPRVGTVWHNASERPLTKADAGKIIVGKDKFGNQICGTLIADGFGLIVKEPSSLDSRTISADRIGVYTLLDPPAE